MNWILMCGINKKGIKGHHNPRPLRGSSVPTGEALSSRLGRSRQGLLLLLCVQQAFRCCRASFCTSCHRSGGGGSSAALLVLPPGHVHHELYHVLLLLAQELLLHELRRRQRRVGHDAWRRRRSTWNGVISPREGDIQVCRPRLHSLACHGLGGEHGAARLPFGLPH